ncbi:M15 family metallopeptidase [Candidatus Falkowbacteria bacterium]|nr:M15 family metallopeptidase [Candidatus Falkowbacteria bacterium]
MSLRSTIISLTIIATLMPCFVFAQTTPAAPTTPAPASVDAVEGPALNIPIPTLPPFSKAIITTNEKGEPQSIDIPWIAEYLIAIYKYALIIGAAFATLLLIFGGFTYMFSGINKSLFEKSKKMILGSISGLIVLLAAYLILYLINPELTKLKSLRLAMVKKSEPVVFDDQPIQQWLSQTKHGPCWNQVVKQSKTEMNLIIDSTCPFLGNNNTGGCAKVVKPIFQKISAEIMADPRWPEFKKIVYAPNGPPGCSTNGKTQRPWIYNWRCAASCSDCDDTTCISKSTGQWKPSPHSFAVAVDIAPCQNPACSKLKDGTYDTECKQYNNGQPIPTNIPTWVLNIFQKHNFIWGGGWKNYYDPMHFEWSGACDEGVVPTADPAALGCCTTVDNTSIENLTVPQCEEMDAINLPTWKQGACS